MSDEMKWVILWKVENRGELWSEIDAWQFPISYDPMKREKRKMVRGRVYQLADIFDNIEDARLRVGELEKRNYVFLSSIEGKRWAVHYRPNESNEDQIDEG